MPAPSRCGLGLGREIGTGRTDILVRKPYSDHQMQREGIELKAWAPNKADPLKAGLQQLDRYLDRFRLDTGTLIIFDRRPSAPGLRSKSSRTRTLVSCNTPISSMTPHRQLRR